MSTDRIDDFGQTLKGARKDAHEQWSEQIAAQQSAPLDLSQPLSKLWPEPAYVKLNVPDPVKQWLRAARDELGTKPGRHMLRSWGSRLYVLRSFTKDLLNHDWGDDTAPEDVARLIDQSHDGLQQAGIVNVDNDGKGWVNALNNRVWLRQGAYQKWGIEKSLRQISFELRDWAGNDERFRAMVRKDKQSVARFYTAPSLEALLNNLERDPLVQEITQTDTAKAKAAPKTPNVKLQIISYPDRKKDGFFIAVKHRSHWVHLARLDSSAEARAMLSDEAKREELSNHYLKWRQTPNERNQENRERSGNDWRAGEDITPERFMETFAFRGVQFGNYVENSRRQQELNETYDALLDMAWALDIEPTSLSLDSTLGLAFGARGKGGKNAPNAHYEPGHRVINLTKTRGAGSLAHEWFHAFDHFVMDQLREHLMSGENVDFLTAHMGRATQGIATENRAATYAMYALRDHPNKAVLEPILKTGAQAFASTQTLIKNRSEQLDKKRATPYWSLDVEIAARAFEAAIEDRLKEEGWSNDYLVNISSDTDWVDMDNFINGLTSGDDAPLMLQSYPYPLAEERAQNKENMLTVFESMRYHSPIFDNAFNYEAHESESIDWDDEPVVAPKKQINLF